MPNRMPPWYFDRNTPPIDRSTPPPSPTPTPTPDYQRVWSGRLGRFVFVPPDDPLYIEATGGPRVPINPEFRNPTVTPAEPRQLDTKDRGDIGPPAEHMESDYFQAPIGKTFSHTIPGGRREPTPVPGDPFDVRTGAGQRRLSDVMKDRTSESGQGGGIAETMMMLFGMKRPTQGQ